MKTLELKKGFYWAGILDPNLRVFDIIMETKFGTTYNSYVLKGSEKTALFETAKEKFMGDYMAKLKEVVDIKDIDYIIVDHTEPDHAGSAKYLLEENPAIKLVGSATAINFMREICNMEFNAVVVKDGDTISLGDKTLKFIGAQNLHWPDSMYTYIVEDKTLVTCDSFGSHYSLDAVLASKIVNRDDYMEALRYYYDNIIGPFKPYVLKAIDKIRDLDIDMICPGHGPVLDSNPWEIVDIYEKWSTEVNPNARKTVVIPYVSAYGYTGMLADKIEEGIRAAGDIEVRKYDLVTANLDTVMGDIYWADGILLGTPTILGEALKPIWDITTSIFPGTHGGKFASAFGSYGWSGEGVPNIIARLKQLRMKVYGEGFRVRFKPSEAQLEDAFDFGFGFGSSVLAGKIIEKEELVAPVVREWKCLVCGEIVRGTQPPEACPVCGVGPDKFVPVETKEIKFQSQEAENIVIIGGGIAGLSAAEAARKRNPVCSIEIISDEEVFCYNRPMLTKGILSEFEALNFFTKQLDWYEENRIKTTLGVKVTAIDRDNKQITLDNGETRKYDKLIYAAGAECNRPPIKGADKKGVEVIRKLADANKIRESLGSVNNVAVIGGGILGLEAAWEFMRAGKKVTIIEAAPAIMGRQLDAKGSALLKAAAIKAGAVVSEGAGVDEITGEGRADGVKTSDGTVYPADLVIISAGIRPNADLAKEAGLDGDRFVEVDDTMRTSDPSIFACGDTAAMNGVSIGIWAQADGMGKVAGANAVGDSETYSHVTPSNTFTGFNTAVFSIGDVGHGSDGHYKEIEISEESKGFYRKMFFLNGRFCGGILIGDTSKSVEMMKAYDKKAAVKDEVILSLMAE